MGVASVLAASRLEDARLMASPGRRLWGGGGVSPAVRTRLTSSRRADGLHDTKTATSRPAQDRVPDARGWGLRWARSSARDKSSIRVGIGICTACERASVYNVRRPTDESLRRRRQLGD
jgi:hypothetical protein